MSRLFVSTYQGRIATLTFDPEAAHLEEIASTEDSGDRPTWLSLDHKRRILYTTDGGSRGSLKSFAIQNDGSLHLLDSIGIPKGPASQTLLHDGQRMTVPFYYSGSIVTYDLEDPSDLKVLQEISFPNASAGPGRRQDQSRPHNTTTDATGRFMVIADLGADIVRVFSIDDSNTPLREISGLHLPRPTFPRQVAFVRLPHGVHMYILCEDSNRLLGFKVDYQLGGEMDFTPVQDVNVLVREDGSVISLWKDPSTPSHGWYPKASHIAVSPDNKFIIVSLRGDYSHRGTSPEETVCDSLVSYAIDPDTGILTIADSASSGGNIPRHFALNKAGDLVAVVAQRNGWISVLNRDPGTGKIGGVVAVKDGFGGDFTGFHGSLRGPVNVVWDE
ncbi:hypothetical protein M409DRAFT_21396 [Zasmidium cellare ATCC 36951]|uniref:Uncharacterized protein n=1 Tax=Zasmidium cellare ATCC 36951 TaxID=1080233 RepID=A0A6A6CPQ4_ZASCE|nr:uncharacterized protein M409DRAFT_21396 [Zasmidium cellare ATCC 36951]KAF2168653.1 hypothetical protein M409DRAFT_21396 [Zasmidium cellare ATCC 36951]